MNYKIRKGVILETICGESLLMATYHARKYCPAIFGLNEASAFIWRLLETGSSIDTIVLQASREYGISLDEADKAVNGFLKLLLENGYLTEEM